MERGAVRVFGCLTEASCTNCRPTWDEELFELRFESLSREHKRGSLLNRSFSDYQVFKELPSLAICSGMPVFDRYEYIAYL